MLYTRRKKIKQKLRIIGLACIGLYVMIGTSLYVLEEKLLFLPSVLEQDYRYDFNYPFEELFLETDKNAVINAIHFKANQPKGVILYFHGNAGDLSRWGAIAEYFVNKQFDVLIMDYRTYGKSTGALSEQALYNDAQFCYDYLKEQYDESKITLYGRSLGSGLATYLGAKNTPKNIILETPYYSIVDVAKQRFPIFPVKQMMRYEFPSYKFIQNVNSPISIIHGSDDLVVSIKSGKKLFSVSNKDRTTFTTIDGGGHNNLIEFEGYHKAIKAILY